LSKHVDLPTLDEHARMAHGLTPEAVGRSVTALLDRRGRRFRVETKEIRGHALIAITMFVFALVLAFLRVLCSRSRSLARRSGYCSFRHCAVATERPRLRN
jgi:hypothetical protein